MLSFFFCSLLFSSAALRLQTTGRLAARGVPSPALRAKKFEPIGTGASGGAVLNQYE